MTSNRASKIALVAVLIAGIALFVGWARSRPSFLLLKAQTQRETKGSSALIVEYENALRKGNLSPEKEIEYRLALGRYFLDVSGEFGTWALPTPGLFKPESPFLEKAKRQFDLVLKKQPQNAEAYFHLGRLLLVRNLNRYAVDELKKSVEADPRFPQPLILLSSIHLNSGKPKEAKARALEALAIAPENNSARWALLEAYGELGELDKAIQTYDALGEDFKNRPEVRAQFASYLLRQNKMTLAEREMLISKQLDPENFWGRLIQAQIWMAKNKPDLAMGELAQASKSNKRSPWPMVWAAKANWLRGETGSSLKQSRLMREVLPSWPWTHMMSAWSDLGLGEGESALKRLDQAFYFSRFLNEAISLKADLSLQMERYDSLGAFIRPYLDEGALEGEMSGYLSLSMARQNQIELAEEVARDALLKNAENYLALVSLGLTRFQQKDWPGAKRPLEKAMEMNPYPDWAPALMGKLIAAEEGPRQGEVFLREELKKRPRSEKILTALGWVNLMDRNPSEALQNFRQATDIAPWLVDAHVGLSESFFQLKDFVAALSAARRGLEINSTHRTLLDQRIKIEKLISS